MLGINSDIFIRRNFDQFQNISLPNYKHKIFRYFTELRVLHVITSAEILLLESPWQTRHRQHSWYIWIAVAYLLFHRGSIPSVSRRGATFQKGELTTFSKFSLFAKKPESKIVTPSKLRIPFQRDWGEFLLWLQRAEEVENISVRNQRHVLSNI